MSAKNIVEPFPGRTDPSVWLRRHPDSVRHRLLLPCDQIWRRHWVFYSVYTQLLADVMKVCDSNNEKRCIFVAQRCTHTDVIIPLWYCVGLHFHSFIVRAITPKGYEAQLTRCGLLGTMQTLHFALRIIPRTTVCEYRAYTWVYDLKLKLRAYTSNVAEFTRLIGDRMTPLSSHYYKDDQFFGRRRVKKVTIKWALFRK